MASAKNSKINKVHKHGGGAQQSGQVWATGSECLLVLLLCRNIGIHGEILAVLTGRTHVVCLKSVNCSKKTCNVTSVIHGCSVMRNGFVTRASCLCSVTRSSLW